MATSADWQAEIQATAGAYLLGDTSGSTGSRVLQSPGIAKQTTLRSSSVPRGGGTGSAPTLERIDRTIITIPVEWYSTTAALLEAELQNARAAWGTFPGDDGELLRLDIREPGTPETVVSYFGRPRPLTMDRTLYKFARTTGLATFEALDPLTYGAEDGPPTTPARRRPSPTTATTPPGGSPSRSMATAAPRSSPIRATATAT